jgi:predicted transcriptional regulator
MTTKRLLLSIRPKYAEMIFNGTKTMELRRVKPNLSINDIVVVYVTSPIKQVWGSFMVSSIICLPINELWHTVQKDAGVTKEEFFDYFLGVNYGYGIGIKATSCVIKPIDLNDIRRNWNGFNPPQSYRYLSHAELNLFYSFA